MTLLFNRVVKVAVTNSAQRLEIEQLRVAFSVKKDDSASQNVCELSIYNLNRVSRSQFEEKDATIELYAGYDGVSQLIFTGDLTFSTHVKQEADIITKVQANDGGVALRESFLFDSFAPGTSVQQILKRTADSLGLAIKEIPQDLKESFANGYSVAGSSKNILDKLKKSFSFTWSIQDGELQITRTNEPTSDTAVVMDETTGMVGIPEVLTADGDTLEKDPDLRDGGVRVRSLLNYQLKPGRLMRLTSTTVNGDYRILSVDHVGDTHGEEWHSVVKAEPL